MDAVFKANGVCGINQFIVKKVEDWTSKKLQYLWENKNDMAFEQVRMEKPNQQLPNENVKKQDDEYNITLGFFPYLQLINGINKREQHTEKDKMSQKIIHYAVCLIDSISLMLGGCSPFVFCHIESMIRSCLLSVKVSFRVSGDER